MDAEAPRGPLPDWDFWSQGLDRTFFTRVYTRSLQIGIVATLALLGLEYRPEALGLISGLAVGLFSLWTVEMTVRLLFNGGTHAGLKLAIGAMVKVPFMLAGLVGLAWAAHRGHLNIFTAVAGVLIVHGSLFVMGVGTAIAHQDRVRERYR